MTRIQCCLPLWNNPQLENDEEAEKKTKMSGYPRYSALLAANDPFFICRRFNTIRARLMLLKQDELCVLEEQLEVIDNNESASLFLGKSRSDSNPDRKAVLSQLDTCLSDYDEFLERTHRILSLRLAEKRDVESLENWIDSTGRLAREETEYLASRGDLMSLTPCGDSAVEEVEAWVLDKYIRFCRGFRKSRYHEVSRDENVHIYSGPLIRRTARGVLLSIITLLLLLPVIICNLVNTPSIRIVIIMLSTIVYLLVLSALAKSRTIELILAGATYATVLIVFVSGTSSIAS